MAKIRVTGKGIHGHYAFEGEVAEEHAAAVIALVVEKAHGGAVPVPPAPRSPEGRKVAGKALSDFGPAELPLSEHEAGALRSKVPTTGQVEQFILKQSERRHSHPLVAREFFGRTVHMAKDSSRAEKRLFYILHRRIEEARRRIEKRDRSGKFTRDNAAFGVHREYRWEQGGSVAG